VSIILRHWFLSSCFPILEQSCRLVLTPSGKFPQTDEAEIRFKLNDQPGKPVFFFLYLCGRINKGSELMERLFFKFVEIRRAYASIERFGAHSKARVPVGPGTTRFERPRLVPIFFSSDSSLLASLRYFATINPFQFLYTALKRELEKRIHKRRT